MTGLFPIQWKNLALMVIDGLSFFPALRR